VIFASTQLKPAFDRLETQFAAANPGVSATATYQGSQALATAVQAGAQGDLFATDADPIGALAAAGAVVTATVQTFARNELEIVVPAGNPKGIQGLQDLANPGASVVLADPSLPAGKDADTSGYTAFDKKSAEIIDLMAVLKQSLGKGRSGGRARRRRAARRHPGDRDRDLRRRLQERGGALGAARRAAADPERRVRRAIRREVVGWVRRVAP